ncbi:MAG: hypothetical protein N0A15_16795, partial [Anaerolineae bacterium]|nr:hypothetical protein [Anaerolineae bacterium]
EAAYKRIHRFLQKADPRLLLKFLDADLPHLSLPPEIRRFWEWYLSQPEVQERYVCSDSSAIACNKLSALFDRAEPKDFVDVYFVCSSPSPSPS